MRLALIVSFFLASQSFDFHIHLRHQPVHGLNPHLLDVDHLIIQERKLFPKLFHRSVDYSKAHTLQNAKPVAKKFWREWALSFAVFSHSLPVFLGKEGQAGYVGLKQDHLTYLEWQCEKIRYFLRCLGFWVCHCGRILLDVVFGVCFGSHCGSMVIYMHSCSRIEKGKMGC